MTGTNVGAPGPQSKLQFNNTRGNGVDVAIAVDGGTSNQQAQKATSGQVTAYDLATKSFNDLAVTIFKGTANKGTVTVATTGPADRATLVLGPSCSNASLQDCALVAYNQNTVVGASNIHIQQT